VLAHIFAASWLLQLLFLTNPGILSTIKHAFWSSTHGLRNASATVWRVLSLQSCRQGERESMDNNNSSNAANLPPEVGWCP
jgi:hypothetical protein